jgi:hypothetical protein
LAGCFPSPDGRPITSIAASRINNQSYSFMAAAALVRKYFCRFSRTQSREGRPSQAQRLDSRDTFFESDAEHPTGTSVTSLPAVQVRRGIRHAGSG